MVCALRMSCIFEFKFQFVYTCSQNPLLLLIHVLDSKACALPCYDGFASVFLPILILKIFGEGYLFCWFARFIVVYFRTGL